jgi:hypothetical protein
VYDGDKVRSMNSVFSHNRDDGIRVDYAERLELIHSQASYNGHGQGELLYGEPDADGAEPNNVDSILINGGSYDYNHRRGIDVDDVHDLTLLAVRASNNYSSGLQAEDVSGSAVVSGGRFEYNGQNGVNIEGNHGFLRSAGSGQENSGATVDVYGGEFFNNYDDGLDIRDVYSANLYGVNARHNGDDGVDVAFVEHLLMGGGFLYGNYEHGVELEYNHYSQLNDVVARENGGNGLDLQGGHRLNVIGGNYSANADWGIKARGAGLAGATVPEGNGFDDLQRVDIKFAQVRHNDSGVYVAYSYLGKLVGGTFSDNSYDGIVFNNVVHGIYQDVYVNNNGEYGLVFDAGLSTVGGTGDPALTAPSQAYLHGSNWNRIDFLGGLYFQNGDDGIYISTDRNQGYYENDIEVNAHHVVSRDNGYTGFRVGGSTYIPEGGYQPASNLDLNMQGGYFGRNGDDGIYLLGVDPTPGPGGLLVANLTDVVANHNGRFGLTGSSVVDARPGNLADLSVDGHEGHHSLIQLNRGSYSLNAADGARLQLAVLEPNLAGNGGEYFSLATFDQVVAVNNGNHGTNVEGFFVVPGGENPEFTAGSESSLNGGPNEAPALVEFWGGVYNQNSGNGIRLLSEFEGGQSPESGSGPDAVAARFQQVAASLNGENGLYLFNGGPEYFRGDVEIIGGAYNANDYDGVFIRGLGDIYVDRVVIVSNKEDGLHSRFNLNTSISQDSVIVNNLVENVRID